MPLSRALASLLLMIFAATPTWAAPKKLEWTCSPRKSNVLVKAWVTLSPGLRDGRIELEDRGGYPPIQILEAPLKRSGAGTLFTFKGGEWNRSGTLTLLSSLAAQAPFEAEFTERTLRMRFALSCKPGHIRY